jgi:AraC family transcriptional regulator, regulatory protein of adaptative response / methylated-DNA-[protein]-cysteine methyltransferase
VEYHITRCNLISPENEKYSKNRVVLTFAMRYDRKQEEMICMRTQATDDYQRIEKAILFLEKTVHSRPDLKEIARSVNLSEYHFQRLFKRWAGISPKRFLQALTLEHAKEALKSSGSLLNVTYEAGLSSSGRLHDLFVNMEAVTPDEFRHQGANLKIRYGFHPSPFGECLVAVTSRGISTLAFVPPGGRSKSVRDLKDRWHRAEVLEDPSATRRYADRIFGTGRPADPLTLHLKGTNFQIKVWQALLNIPRGAVASYEDIAKQISRPGAVRAVANAVAHNPVAFLIPCHRVIRKTGAVGGYRWGSTRKKALLAWEASRENQLTGGEGGV